MKYCTREWYKKNVIKWNYIIGHSFIRRRHATVSSFNSCEVIYGTLPEQRKVIWMLRGGPWRELAVCLSAMQTCLTDLAIHLPRSHPFIELCSWLIIGRVGPRTRVKKCTNWFSFRARSWTGFLQFFIVIFGIWMSRAVESFSVPFSMRSGRVVRWP